jgi:hypothetical protein
MTEGCDYMAEMEPDQDRRFCVGHKDGPMGLGDQTEAGVVAGAWSCLGRNECELVRSLSRLPVPIRGFSSTDCPVC